MKHARQRNQQRQESELTGGKDDGRLKKADGDGGETLARPSWRCGSRRREQTAPATSTQSGEAPEVLLDDGEAMARRIEGDGGTRVTSGGAQEESGSGTAEVGDDRWSPPVSDSGCGERRGPVLGRA
jgi:hypothetical protein